MSGDDGYIVLVCGGRNFADKGSLFGTLDRLHQEQPIDYIITGMAPGADTLAYHWAIMKQVGALQYPADWKKHGRAAGPIRNQQMLDEGKPDLVVAFPGGTGTADMIRRVEKARIWLVKP